MKVGRRDKELTVESLSAPRAVLQLTFMGFL